MPVRKNSCAGQPLPAHGAAQDTTATLLSEVICHEQRPASPRSINLCSISDTGGLTSISPINVRAALYVEAIHCCEQTEPISGLARCLTDKA